MRSKTNCHTTPGREPAGRPRRQEPLFASVADRNNRQPAPGAPSTRPINRWGLEEELPPGRPPALCSRPGPPLTDLLHPGLGAEAVESVAAHELHLDLQGLPGS